MSAIVPKLKANFETGEGEVLFLGEWHNLDGLMRKDLLKDWIFELQTEYNGLSIFTKPGERSGE